MTSSSQSDAPYVRFESLSKTYGTVTALRPIDFELHRGEFITLLGPSGSGKTTLLNIVAGMIEPSSGRLWIDGLDMTAVKPAKRGLGMVFQNYALMPHMTVFENIAFPLRIRKAPAQEIRKRVGEVLDLVRLSDFGDRKPRELSGGQQQRVSLARCIVYNPKIILMDEPLGALDLKLRRQMQTEIKRIHTELGVTMIYVTHDQEEALTMSDRIIIMNGGSIEQSGTPSEIYMKPDTVFVADFIGECTVVDAEILDDRRIRLGREAIVIKPNVVGAGRKVQLVIRPESVVFDNSGSGEHAVRARVVSSRRIGPTTKHLVMLGDTALSVSQQGGDAIALDTEVGLAFNTEEISILEKT